MPSLRQIERITFHYIQQLVCRHFATHIRTVEQTISEITFVAMQAEDFLLDGILLIMR